MRIVRSIEAALMATDIYGDMDEITLRYRVRNGISAPTSISEERIRQCKHMVPRIAVIKKKSQLDEIVEQKLKDRHYLG